MQIIRQSSFTAAPWKNGGGITYEAIRVPAEGESFLWRVSVARIDVSGPFSDFAAYHRTMILLRGEGVALNFANGEERVLREVGDMAEFDGGLATQCELLRGPCVDLNLMTAKTLRDVHTRVERFDRRLPISTSADRRMLIFAVQTPIELEVGSDKAVLEPWDLAVLTGSFGAGSLVPREGAEAPATVFLASLPYA
jgi:uncharacterized protein